MLTNLQPPLLCLPENLFFEGSTAGHAGVLLHTFTHPFLLRLFSKLSVVLSNLNKSHVTRQFMFYIKRQVETAEDAAATATATAATSLTKALSSTKLCKLSVTRSASYLFLYFISFGA